MSMTDPDISGCQRLVEAFEQEKGYPLAEAVRRAFLLVDRHHFVPSHYVRDGYDWKAQPVGPEVYEDRVLVTSLDHRGIPNSSSSQPSLMAYMLSALDLASGMRVLEIGTGTGYNAALIGTIVGPAGKVMSVDIRPDLIAHVAPRLMSLPGVHVTVADGLQGYKEMAPYDRIIATGASQMVPPAWLEQLAVGGILIGSLATGLTTVTPLYRLVKHNDGSVDGTFLPTPAFFMDLYEHEQEVELPWDDTFYTSLPMIEQDETDLNLLSLLRNASFDLFVKQHLPDLQAHLRIQRQQGTAPMIQEIYIFLPDHAMLTCTHHSQTNQPWHIEARGSVPLWSRLLEIYHIWEQQGQPDLSRYHIAVENGQCCVQLSSTD